ncbi:MAG: dipeptidase PepE [Rhodothermales bacterium]|nr:dipeptidase PepE [Rhodothermales bacterium]
MSRRLLLLSNSVSYGQGYLEHAEDAIRAFLGDGVNSIAFVPYAGVTISEDQYAAKVRAHFEPIGYAVVSVHEVDNPEDLVRSADAIAVGGGNTFRLLQQMTETGLLSVVRERVIAGVPYIGWSAGSNLACPTIRTTNDMPIVEPPSFAALHLIPFQINPHYLDAHPDKHQGETREQRLLEFVTLNPDTTVVGLREGSILRVEAERMRLLGDRTMRVFHGAAEPAELGPDEELSFMLNA